MFMAFGHGASEALDRSRGMAPEDPDPDEKDRHRLNQ
jgi:hypothetical protein